MATQTTTVTGGYLDGDLYFPTSTLGWQDLPVLTWGDWTDWGATEYFIGENPLGGYNDIVITITDDLDVSKFRRPTCSFSTTGSATVTLKISDSGQFSGEETTINFTLNSLVSFVKGRYYRWTFTITSDSDTDIPSIGVPTTAYDQEQRIVYFNDLDLAGLSTDSEGDYIVDTTSIGTVTHVQGTSVQGEPYVAEDYVELQGTDKYIEDQVGGAVVIESKNPLTVSVVDHTGTRWDGTVDLMVRGFEQIQLFADGVR